MSGRVSRLAFSSSAAALALLLVAPSAALACEKNGDGGGQSGSGQSKQAKSKQSKSDHDEHAKGKDDAGAKGDSDSKDGHNPPGNNGTIKIDYAAPADSGHANRPHPGCAFQLRMFNFDDDQFGTITFVGQAPTKLGTLLTQTHVLLSNDAAGGGKDVDEVYAYTAQQLGLIGKPQAKQGWHIKVSVDAENAPGGAKHKVFWLKCDEPATSGTSNTGTTTQGGSTTATKPVTTTTTTSSTTTTATTATGTTAGAATAGAAAPAAAAPAAAAATTVTGGEAAAAAAPAAPAAPAAQPASRGSALPFTGSNVITMLLIALAALAAGGLAVRAGRRRTAGL